MAVPYLPIGTYIMLVGPPDGRIECTPVAVVTGARTLQRIWDDHAGKQETEPYDGKQIWLTTPTRARVIVFPYDSDYDGWVAWHMALELVSQEKSMLLYPPRLEEEWRRLWK
jgi:hypothetical protein